MSDAAADYAEALEGERRELSERLARAEEALRAGDPYVDASGSRALLRGSRVTVARLWSWHRRGVAVETLLKRYPSLGPARVLGALAWAYVNQARVERELEAEERALLAELKGR